MKRVRFSDSFFIAFLVLSAKRFQLNETVQNLILNLILFLPIGEYGTTPAKDIETDRHHRGSDGKVRARSKRSNDPSPTADSEIEVIKLTYIPLVNPARETVASISKSHQQTSEF